MHSLHVNYHSLIELSFTNNQLYHSMPHEAAECGIEISRLLLVNSCRETPIIHALSALTCKHKCIQSSQLPEKTTGSYRLWNVLFWISTHHSWNNS